VSSMVQGPDGRVWTVERNVWPWRTPAELLSRAAPKRGQRSGDLEEVADTAWLATEAVSVFDDWLAPIAIVTAMLALLAFGGLILAGLAAVVLALWALVAAGAVACWRILGRRPWTITAMSSTGEILRWRVFGWQASRAKVADVERALRQGNPPPPTDLTDA